MSESKVPDGDNPPPAPPSPATSRSVTAGFYEPYAEYAKTLRNWLAGYGIGGLLFLSNEKILAQLKDKGDAHNVATCFILGVVCQVLLAFINKVLMWAVYYGEDRPEFRKTCLYQFSDWFSEQFWVDVVFDLGSLYFFAWATLIALMALS